MTIKNKLLICKWKFNRPSSFFPCLLSIAFPDFGNNLGWSVWKKILRKIRKSLRKARLVPPPASLLGSLEETGKQKDNFEHKINMVEESFGWCYSKINTTWEKGSTTETPAWFLSFQQLLEKDVSGYIIKTEIYWNFSN